LAASRIVNDYEGARTQHERFLQFGSRIGEKLAQLVVRGLEISAQLYGDSLQLLQAAAEEMEGVFTEYPFLLTPAAPGCAPPGLASTGDPVMNAVWTALGAPAISLPMPIRGELPLGLQMIGRRGADGELLGAAMAVERIFKEVVSEPSSPFLLPLI
jgi:Asp-tRNA(Asn)/Glu-tRNA(Gln) amidotransferase A subunit family amidase